MVVMCSELVNKKQTTKKRQKVNQLIFYAKKSLFESKSEKTNKL